MSRVLNDLPRRFHAALHAALGPARYALWTSKVRPVGFDEERFTFHVAGDADRERLEALVLPAVTAVARETTNRNIRLALEVEPASFPPAPAPAPPPIPQTVATFVPGPGSRMALSAARSFATGAPGSPRLLVLCARSGLGRTHLLRAIQHALGGPRNPGVIYYPGEAFRRYAEEAERRGRLDAFLRKSCAASVFLLDDLHLLRGRASAALALAGILASLQRRGDRAALASEAPPRAIEGLPRALQSRLRADVEVAVDLPDEAAAAAVLRQTAPGAPPAIVSEIVQHVRSNHADRIECLRRTLSSPSPTPASARAVAAEFLSEWSFGLTYDDIVRAASQAFGVRATEIYAPDRSRGAAEARQACFYLARKLLGKPFAQIGAHFGGRDHSTVLEACRKLARARGVLKERLRKLEERLAPLVPAS